MAELIRDTLTGLGVIYFNRTLDLHRKLLAKSPDDEIELTAEKHVIDYYVSQGRLTGRIEDQPPSYEELTGGAPQTLRQKVWVTPDQLKELHNWSLQQTYNLLSAATALGSFNALEYFAKLYGGDIGGQHPNCVHTLLQLVLQNNARTPFVAATPQAPGIAADAIKLFQHLKAKETNGVPRGFNNWRAESESDLIDYIEQKYDVSMDVRNDVFTKQPFGGIAGLGLAAGAGLVGVGAGVAAVELLQQENEEEEQRRRYKDDGCCAGCCGPSGTTSTGDLFCCFCWPSPGGTGSTGGGCDIGGCCDSGGCCDCDCSGDCGDCDCGGCDCGGCVGGCSDCGSC